MRSKVIDQWHEILKTKDVAALDALLAEEAVFHSPIVHAPQVGRALTGMYLRAAFHVLVNDTFTYVRQVVGEHDAVLEFTTELDGIIVNGIDLIRWNNDNKITDFKVMVRPLKGMNKIHQMMAAQLQAGQNQTETNGEK